MKYIIIDLEWNGSFSGRLGRYFNEIIEIGAVSLNDDLKPTDKFSMLVSPTFNKKLSGRVKKLTHISNSEVSGGISFKKAISAFSQWVGNDDNCVLSFGTGDILVLLENYAAYDMGDSLPFMKSYCDLQQLCQHGMEIDAGQQLGLSTLAERLGITVEDMDMHRALDDSIVSAECIRRTFDNAVFDSMVRKADSEFYRWITFKTVSICDIDNPVVNKAKLIQRCPECGAILKRTTAFVSKNRCFVTSLVCGVCGRRFTGKHYIKLKYEGLSLRSALTEIGVENEHNEEETEKPAE